MDFMKLHTIIATQNVNGGIKILDGYKFIFLKYFAKKQGFFVLEIIEKQTKNQIINII